MFYDCVDVHFTHGNPSINMDDKCTVHMLSREVQMPRNTLRVGDAVVIGPVSRPLLKVIVNKHRYYKGVLGGLIIGKVLLFKDNEK